MSILSLASSAAPASWNLSDSCGTEGKGNGGEGCGSRDRENAGVTGLIGGRGRQQRGDILGREKF